MKRVTGASGVVFKARDADALRAWYRADLGIEIDSSWGGFGWVMDPKGNRSELWQPMKKS